MSFTTKNSNSNHKLLRSSPDCLPLTLEDISLPQEVVPEHYIDHQEEQISENQFDDQAREICLIRTMLRLSSIGCLIMIVLLLLITFKSVFVFGFPSVVTLMMYTATATKLRIDWKHRCQHIEKGNVTSATVIDRQEIPKPRYNWVGLEYGTDTIYKITIQYIVPSGTNHDTTDDMILVKKSFTHSQRPYLLHEGLSNLPVSYLPGYPSSGYPTLLLQRDQITNKWHRTWTCAFPLFLLLTMLSTRSFTNDTKLVFFALALSTVMVNKIVSDVWPQHLYCGMQDDILVDFNLPQRLVHLLVLELWPQHWFHNMQSSGDRLAAFSTGSTTVAARSVQGRQL